jgi:nucleoside-diphosphate-sugar epimerase
LPKEIELISTDLTCASKKLNEFVDGVDILYHCAAEIGDQSKMNMAHINGTINLCNAASGRIGHWVQLSSVGVYGPHHSGLITEVTQLNPIGIYETTKAKSDQLVVKFAAEGAFTCTILRPSNIFGPTMSNQSIFQLIKMIDRGFFFFIGKAGASANYINVDNVAEALMLCGTARDSRIGVFNLSDHRPLETFVAVIADELGCPTPKLRLPERPVRWLLQVFGWIPGVPLTSSRINAMTARSVYSIQKIQKELGYIHRIPMEEGIRQLVRDWKQSR